MNRVGGVLLLVLAGCAAPDEPFAKVVAPIVDGVPSPPSDDAVVQLVSPAGLCTGTLVAPNLVLTARHCLATVNTDLGVCAIDGSTSGATSLVYSNVQPEQVEVRIGAQIPADPTVLGKQIVATQSTAICLNDIALVVLERNLEGMPIMPLRLTRPTLSNELTTIVGYGMPVSSSGGSDPLADRAPSVRLRREAVPVVSVGPNRFDSAAGVGPRGTMLLGPGMCHGDSGGPAISERTGAVIGVASITGATCTDTEVNVYTDVAQFYDVVLEAFAIAGQEPWLEGEATVMATEQPEASGCTLAQPMAAGRRHAAMADGWRWWMALVFASALGAWRRCARQATPLAGLSEAAE